MRIILSLCCLSFLLVVSCKPGKDELNTEPILKLNETIVIDGISRNFHVQYPPNPNNNPLVILLHGHGGSADQSIGLELSKSPQRIWLDVAKDEEFIVLVPNGELGPEDSRGWNDCRTDAIGNPSTNDVKFIDCLIDRMQQEYNHDINKVYVAGISNGALMSQRLAQEMPEKITAFASIINSAAENSICSESEEPISALFMNGTMDPLVPYDGGQILNNRGEVKSTDESVQYWIARNQTDTTPIVEIIENSNTDDNSNVEKSIYANGTNNTEVILYKIIGGGHTEPSKVQRYAQIYLSIVGGQNGDMEMAEEVWQFFKDKSK